MYEKIKFSNFRNVFLGLRYYFRLFINKKGLLERLDDKSLYLLKRKIGVKKILIFCPSLNLDTPNFLNIGLRAFINSAKCVGAQIEFVQCINFLNICHLGGSPFSPNNKMPCFSCKKVNSKILIPLYGILKIKKENVKVKKNLIVILLIYLDKFINQMI